MFCGSQQPLPSLKFLVKWGFHETTEMNKIDHRCIQIDLWVLETGRPQQKDIGAIRSVLIGLSGFKKGYCVLLSMSRCQKIVSQWKF